MANHATIAMAVAAELRPPPPMPPPVPNRWNAKAPPPMISS